MEHIEEMLAKKKAVIRRKCQEVERLQQLDGNASMIYYEDVVIKALDVYASLLEVSINTKERGCH